MRMSRRLMVLSAGLLALGAMTFTACGGTDEADADDTPPPTQAPSETPSGVPNSDLPVGVTPDNGPQEATGEPLVDARHDLAERLGIDVSQVYLIELRHAGFNGCLGVIDPAMACTEQFIAGYIAIFEVEGETSRYHFGGSTFIATDFVEGDVQIEDGVEVEPMMQYDFGRALAAYAADDLATRLGIDISDIVTKNIVPVTFTDGCLGYVRPEALCLQGLVDGFVILFLAEGETYRYHLSADGVMVATDFEETGFAQEPEDAAVVAVQDAMRADLAERLGLSVDEISLASYRNVTWNDGCLGVARPDTTCIAALTPGFVAELVAGDGNLYRYHGDHDGYFIATDFEPEYAVIEMFPAPAETPVDEGEPTPDESVE